MKYIKKYDSDEFLNLKKYIILDITNFEYEKGDLTILQKLYYQNDKLNLITKQLYTYENNEILESKGEDFMVFLDDINTIILYTSDDLDDCIEKLPLLTNLNKYNI